MYKFLAEVVLTRRRKWSCEVLGVIYGVMCDIIVNVCCSFLLWSFNLLKPCRRLFSVCML